jgi:hypothetical protein
MKALLCVLFLCAITIGQTDDERKKDHDEHECKARYLILESGTESLKLLPGFQENHSAFAQASDLYTHADAGFRAPYINFYKSRGTRASPTPVTFTGYELDSIGGINFGGWDGEKYFAGSAALYTQSDEDWTPTSHGGHLSIYATNPNGGHTQQVAQFGGRGPNGEANENMIFYRGLSFGGAQSGNPSLIPTSNPPVIHVKTADGSGDAAFTMGSLTITAPHTPATAFEACLVGTIVWDSNFVYVCVATNTWRRSALAAW